MRIETRTAKNNGGNTVQTRRTLGQYRIIDLSIFAVIMMLTETLIIRAATEWFSAAAWTVSVVPAVTAIVMVRWGPWCALHAVLGGLVFCFHLKAGAVARGVLLLADRTGAEGDRYPVPDLRDREPGCTGGMAAPAEMGMGITARKYPAGFPFRNPDGAGYARGTRTDSPDYGNAAGGASAVHHHRCHYLPVYSSDHLDCIPAGRRAGRPAALRTADCGRGKPLKPRCNEARP